jgi:antitoxin CcdA
MRMPRRRAKPSRRTPRRKPTNVSLRADLVDKARGLKINLSSLLEEALIAAIRKREQEDWLAQNAEAIDACNAHMKKHGLFSDDWREF